MANWPNNKHIECNVNNDIPVKIPSFPNVLLNQSVLYNCEIKVENHFMILYYIILYMCYMILLYYTIIGGVGIVGIDMLSVCTCLFKLRPGVLSETLSHMWGKFNLPLFLFNVGLLTLMNIRTFPYHFTVR